MEDVSLEWTEGEVMVIEFWAAWCKPSLKNIAHLRDIAKKNLPARFITLSVDESFEKA
jgi:hypothetical protein